ncbi:hypothetical protein [Halosimplex amylolyticum]|uniref:hypothetical protein n=1 Tax=Halosimplex amylolyticum TaxID=3396616 RepID=UPI003F55DA22
MRRVTQRIVAVAAVLMLVSAAYGAAVHTGAIEEDGPVGEAEAIACGGLCLVGAGTAVGIAAGAGIGYMTSEYFHDSEVNKTKIESLASEDKEISIYESASSERQNDAIYADSLDNYLQDTRSIATMEAKNTYIRELNNQSSEAVARSEAKQTASDYYAKKQAQLIAQWNTSAIRWMSYKETIMNDSNINAHFVEFEYASASGSMDVSMTKTVVRTVTLANGTDMNVLAFRNTAATSSPEFGITENDVNYDTSSYEINYATVSAPNSNYDKAEFMNVSQYNELWAEIGNQNSQIQTRVDTFVDNTYSSYQRGSITTDDLIDPYLAAREYSPEGEYGSYTLRSFVSMGKQPPANMSGVGTMKIVNEDTDETYNGLLMSDGLPAGGEFTIGTQTYDAADLEGRQFVVNTTDGTTTTLNGNFTVQNVTKPSGENLNQTSIKYREINYTHTSTDEYQQTMEDLRKTTAELEARQQKLLDQGGGVGFLPGGFGGSTAIAVIATVLLAVLLIPVVYRT